MVDTIFDFVGVSYRRKSGNERASFITLNESLAVWTMNRRPTHAYLSALDSSRAVYFYFLSAVPDALPVKTVRQYLPPKPGYVPVYIQEGDTPPDVASIYEGPVEDEADTDALSDDSQDLDDSSLRALRQSEEFIIQQLTDSVKDNEVRGVVEVVPK